MSVFIDTGVFFAHHDQAAARYEAASTAMQAVLEGKFGEPYTSDYVVDEAITLTRKRTGNYEDAWEIGRRILGRGRYPDRIELLVLTPDLFEDTLDTFETYDDHSLSFTDASTIAAVERNDLDAVLSFDDDFDGVVERIDPAIIGG
ncbi:type II toxin-antitoxin system VapC family toxin [Natrarchaeobius chitinivorans]|uniref:PIN domain-containing protein n=1 Tax=Natrarchaeobius chitinivorans TaxID=1679083 RepID=A0A3N6LWR6_NATCH|nr:PIN domain-containing protein [Natrarchaeobius chitinivorans]RQG95118.1 PIN domain-containing protein [Natrarchaeobius chitinivorans]